MTEATNEPMSDDAAREAGDDVAGADAGAGASSVPASDRAETFNRK